jgi:PAT family acetyl-CoA transporter-like MFS transporter 1
MPPASGNPSSPEIPPVIPSISDSYTVPTHAARHQELRHYRTASETADAVQLELFDTPSSHPQSPHFSSRRRPSSESLHIDIHDPSTQSEPLLQADLDDESSEQAQMGRRKASPNTQTRQTSFDSLLSQNGHASGAMEGNLLEHRRKHAALESPNSATATAHLMSRSTFSLDEPVPALPNGHESEHASKGFSELPRQDRRNFLLLVLLYFLQGVPMGLAMGSVPFLLKQHVSYAQMGVFSLASYPYSLKLLWSPIVDAIWSPKFGRRKSWILPIQTLSGISMIWLAGNVDAMMNHAGENGGQNVWGFTWWWFALVFMCATQDIAVDGWALTLLSPEHISYASTAQTVGLTAGQFLSSTVFLAFNSKDFANKWFRTIPGDEGLISLSTALALSGWLYLIVTVGLAALKTEEKTKNDEGVWDVYKVMFRILKLKNIQTLIVVHLIAKIGFQANDGATMLKMLDKGFGQDNLSLTVLIDFPFEIGLGYYVGKWSSAYGPMKLWSWAFIGRLFAAALAQFIVYIFPSTGVSTGYLLLVIFGHVLSTFMNTVMFVAVSAFHAKVADPVYGGTYMTLLATYVEPFVF